MSSVTIENFRFGWNPFYSIILWAIKNGWFLECQHYPGGLSGQRLNIWISLLNHTIKMQYFLSHWLYHNLPFVEYELLFLQLPCFFTLKISDSNILYIIELAFSIATWNAFEPLLASNFYKNPCRFTYKSRPDPFISCQGVGFYL